MRPVLFLHRWRAANVDAPAVGAANPPIPPPTSDNATGEPVRAAGRHRRSPSRRQPQGQFTFGTRCALCSRAASKRRRPGLRRA